MSSGFEDRLRKDVAAVTTYLEGVLSDDPDTPPRLVAAMRHAVLGSGKRFRPFLVIESARLFGIAPADALPAAAALECVHCYSLVHDDLPAMDNDTLRRGQPTVWAAFDDWTAILAGDALLTLAFEIAARPETHPAAEVRSHLIALLARASGRSGMVGGQCLDLEADKLDDPAAREPAHIRRLQSMKTGALIRFACEAGAVLAEASANELAALADYGDHLGFAFQIADDLLDAEGDADHVGKATGKDEAAGKATLVSMIGLDGARAELVRARQAALDALAPFGVRAETLKAAAEFAVARSR